MNRQHLPLAGLGGKAEDARPPQPHIHHKGYRNRPLTGTSTRSTVCAPGSRAACGTCVRQQGQRDEADAHAMRRMATTRSHLDRVMQPVLQHAPLRIPADDCGFRRLRLVTALRPNIENGMEIGSCLVKAGFYRGPLNLVNIRL